jgi:hypothetical protein
MARAVALSNPASTAAARTRRAAPGSAFGKRASASWMPLEHARETVASRVGSPPPPCVTSVVPSTNCAPESIRNNCLGSMRRLVLRVTR